jgi:hypothetical protein
LQTELLQAEAMKKVKVLLIFPKWGQADDIYPIFTRDPVKRCTIASPGLSPMKAKFVSTPLTAFL